MGSAALSRLVGRQSELVALVGTLDSLESTRASWAQITGAPGIGKTRLAGELCELAEARGVLVLAGRGTELERDVPFGVVVDAFDDYLGSQSGARLSELCGRQAGQLRRIFPALAGRRLPEALGSGDERYPALRALRFLVERLAVAGPLVIVLDDLQWADAASLALVSFLLRRPPEVPLLLVAMWRPGQAHRLADALTLSGRDLPGIAIELGGLAEDEVGELLGGAVPAPRLAALHRASGGNPFYAQALAAAADRDGAVLSPSREDEYGGAVPGPVAAAVHHEIDSLSPEARLLAQGAAVVGEPFELELAARCAMLADDVGLAGLDELVGSGIVHPAQSPRRFVFRHPIVRRAIYDSVGPGWKLGAHARAAAVLIERGGSLITTAHHTAQSAAPGDVAAAELLIAAAAESGAAPVSAAGWLGAAAAILPRRPDTLGTRLTLLCGQARVSSLLGDLHRAHDALSEALELLPVGDVRRQQLVAGVAGVEHGLGRFVDARARLLAAVAELAGTEVAAEAVLCVELAVSSLHTLDFAEASAWATRALEVAGSVDRLLEGTARALLAFVYASAERSDEVETARAHQAHGARILGSLGDGEVALRLDSLYYLGWAERLLEDYDAAAAHLGRAVAVADAGGGSQWLVPAVVEHAKALARCGRITEARDVAETAVEMAKVSGTGPLILLALTAEVAVLADAGDVDAAVAAGSEALCLGAQGDAYHIANVRRHLALAHLEGGDPARCVAELAEIDAGSQAVVRDGMRCRLLDARCEAELALGHVDAARALGEEAADAAGGLPASTGFAHRARARVVALAQPEEALGLTDVAAGLFERAGAHVEMARTKVLAAEILATCGRSDEAFAELSSARETLGACGAHGSAEQARRMLRCIGRARSRSPGQRRSVSGAGALSRREREIAELVAEGRTNHQIADRLSISANTVESHLGAILAKLDVHGRGGVARTLR
ncbi:MAG: ATP-binding protein [Acidimicrobiales bacterium]